MEKFKKNTKPQNNMNSSSDSDQHLIRRNQDGAVPRLHRSLPFPSQQQPPPELQPPRRNQSVNESSTSRPRPNPVSRSTSATLIPPPRPSSKSEASGVIKEENTFTENLIDFQPKPIKNDFTDFLGDLYKLQTTNLFEKTK